MAIGQQQLETPIGKGTERRATTSAPRMSARNWLLLGLLSLIWGGSFFFAKVAVEDIGPLTVVLGRVALAAVILNLLVVSRGLGMPQTVTGWTPFIVMGVLNSIIPYSLIFWGEIHIASGLAAILNATTPLFTMLVAHVATADERLTPAKIGGVLLGLIGVIVIMGRDLFEIASGNGLAQLAVLAASLPEEERNAYLAAMNQVTMYAEAGAVRKVSENKTVDEATGRSLSTNCWTRTGSILAESYVFKTNLFRYYERVNWCGN